MKRKKVKGYLGVGAVLILGILLSGCGGDQPEKDLATKEVQVKRELTADAYFAGVVNPYIPVFKAYRDLTGRPFKALASNKIKAVRAAVDLLRERFPELSSVITSTADKIAGIPGYKGDTSLRDAVLDYVEYLEEEVNSQWPELLSQLERYTDDTNPFSDEDLAYLNELIDKINREGDEQGEKFEQAQEDFAKKYGFMLKPGLY